MTCATVSVLVLLRIKARVERCALVRNVSYLIAIKATAAETEVIIKWQWEFRGCEG